MNIDEFKQFYLIIIVAYCLKLIKFQFQLWKYRIFYPFVFFFSVDKPPFGHNPLTARTAKERWSTQTLKSIYSR